MSTSTSVKVLKVSGETNQSSAQTVIEAVLDTVQKTESDNCVTKFDLPESSKQLIDVARKKYEKMRATSKEYEMI